MKNIRSLFLLVSIFIINTSHINATAPQVGAQAEWNSATHILMHTPSDEVFFGVLHADAALFEGPFDMYAAAQEHKKYIDILTKHNIKVTLIEDVLLQGTMNDDGTKKEGWELDKLIEFAGKSLTYMIPNEWDDTTKEQQKKYKEQALRQLHPKSLVRILFEKPIISLKRSMENNTSFIAESYRLSPLANLHFLRDQQITTDKGVVLGKMNSTQRNLEVDIMEFVFHKLDIQPLYRVTGEGRLEGGVFIPAGDFALIGQGLRTNAEGVRQLLENNVFGFKEIAVVKDPFKHQNQMHLDTYFNIAGDKIAIIDTIRRETGLINHHDEVYRKIRPTVDVYIKNDESTYVLTQENVDFFEYIEEQKGFTLIDIEDSEQLNYGCNFLCIGDNTAVCVNGVSDQYEQKLKNAGIEVISMDFGNITKSYGGPHCTTQVISRS